jgi:glycosyltransferase involved in cell wall biosynthesis
MRVLHVIPALAVRHGGPSFAAADMVQALRNAGVECEIVCTQDGQGRHYDSLWPEGAPAWVHHLRAGPLASFAYSHELDPWLRQRVAGFDLVHIHGLFRYSTRIAARNAARLRVPYVITPHGALDEWGLRRRRIAKALYLRLVEAPTLRRAAGLHCTSRAEARSPAITRLGRPVFIIPIGVGLRPSLHPGSAAGETVLFLSRLDPKKRLEMLLQALPRLISDHPNLRCVVAGNGEAAYETRLRRLAARLQLGDRVVFEGLVTGTSKQKLFDQADVFVLPSEDESFGVAVAEAMAAGVPVVVTHGVALSEEIAQNQAGMVVEDTPAALAGGIDYLLREREAAHRLARNARRLMIEQFAWHAVTAKLTEMYQAVRAHAVPAQSRTGL